MRMSPRARVIALVSAVLLWCGGASAQPAARSPSFQLYAAGSLAAAFDALLATSGAVRDGAPHPIYGPSGLLRQRLEHGGDADLFASSDLSGPEQIAQEGPARTVLLFARDRLCAIARPTLGLTTANVLSRLLDPAVRVATSTPGTDPSGDYSQELFRRAERLQPGAGATLRGKAIPLLGRTVPPPGTARHDPVGEIFAANKADVLLSYCSRTSRAPDGTPDLVSVPLPFGLEVKPDFGMVLLTGNPAAARFALYVMSLAGQETLARFGFIPVAVP